MKVFTRTTEITLQLTTIYMEIIYLGRRVALCIEQLIRSRISNTPVDPKMTSDIHELIDGYRIEIRILQEHTQSLLKIKSDF